MVLTVPINNNKSTVFTQQKSVFTESAVWLSDTYYSVLATKAYKALVVLTGKYTVFGTDLRQVVVTLPYHSVIIDYRVEG